MKPGSKIRRRTIVARDKDLLRVRRQTEIRVLRIRCKGGRTRWGLEIDPKAVDLVSAEH